MGASRGRCFTDGFASLIFKRSFWGGGKREREVETDTKISYGCS